MEHVFTVELLIWNKVKCSIRSYGMVFCKPQIHVPSQNIRGYIEWALGISRPYSIREIRLYIYIILFFLILGVGQSRGASSSLCREDKEDTAVSRGEGGHGSGYVERKDDVCTGVRPRLGLPGLRGETAGKGGSEGDGTRARPNPLKLGSALLNSLQLRLHSILKRNVLRS